MHAVSHYRRHIADINGIEAPVISKAGSPVRNIEDGHHPAERQSNSFICIYFLH